MEEAIARECLPSLLTQRAPDRLRVANKKGLERYDVK
jgi:hypothetical protein